MSRPTKAWPLVAALMVAGFAGCATRSARPPESQPESSGASGRGRAKRARLRVVLVGTGGLPEGTVRRVGDLLRADHRLQIVSLSSTDQVKPSSPLGGVEGADQLAGAQKPDLVVGVMAGAEGALFYEVVDLKKGIVLADSSTRASTDPRLPVEEVAAAVSSLLPAGALPSPSGSGTVSSTTSPALTPTATPTATALSSPLPHPNAPLTPSPR